jgi:2-polyprenyl-6-hydroxyphenyl methylase/3-demethylubiquinone-9 3-methyltransferase
MTDKKKDKISFSFGRNWQNFLKEAEEKNLLAAKNDLVEWLGAEMIQGKRVLDIGCGSGIHSWAFWDLGASQVFSFDFDPDSVTTARILWDKCGKPGNWEIQQASILDKRFVTALQKRPFDIVYAWGVLHHTGDLWTTMENTCSLPGAGGRLWLALYVKGPRYERDLKLKWKFNKASPIKKEFLIWRYKVSTLIKWILFRNWKALRNHFSKKQKILARGMNLRHDVIDWLGGLPYEVASAEEVLAFCRQRGFQLEKIRTANEGGNNIFLFSRPS